MAHFVVIPFLLGMIATPNRIADEVHFEHNFEVDIWTLFRNIGSLKGHHGHLSLGLKCYAWTDGMICRVGKYNVMQPVPEELPEISQFEHLNRTLLINHTNFHNESEPFQINFSPSGIDGYVVENNTISPQMINVYRMIANQLSVGTEIKGKGREFEEMERSNIGLCPVKYMIKRRQPRFKLDINLTSLFGPNLEVQTIIILKQRNIAQCRSLSNFSFSARFWPELMSIMGVSHTLVESHGALMMSARGTESLTENVYNIYDKSKKLVADITETITLRLNSYGPLPSNRVMTLDKEKTVLLDVINND